MPELQLSKEAEPNGSGRYVARIEGIEAAGEIAFTQRGSNVISADHTEVADELRGKGVAKAYSSLWSRTRGSPDFASSLFAHLSARKPYDIRNGRIYS